MNMKQNERRTAFILAAGLGTRLKELTSDRPKAMVEMNGKPLLEYVIDKLISQNFNHFVINIHHFGEKIIDFVKEKKYDGVEIEISYTIDDETLTVTTSALGVANDTVYTYTLEDDVLTLVDGDTTYRLFKEEA